MIVELRTRRDELPVATWEFHSEHDTILSAAAAAQKLPDGVTWVMYRQGTGYHDETLAPHFDHAIKPASAEGREP